MEKYLLIHRIAASECQLTSRFTKRLCQVSLANQEEIELDWVINHLAFGIPEGQISNHFRNSAMLLVR